MTPRPHALSGRKSNAAKQNPRSAALPQVRCTPEELEAAKQSALAGSQSLSDYIRSKVFTDSKPAIPPAAKTQD